MARKKKNSVTVHITIVDMDGVFADCTHRLKYAEKKDYEKFYYEVALVPNHSFDSIVKIYHFVIACS